MDNLMSYLHFEIIRKKSELKWTILRRRNQKRGKIMEMTKEQYEAFIEKIEQQARDREKTIGQKQFHADDFFAGVMAATEALGYEKQWALPRWIFGIMQGEAFWRK